MCSMDVLKTTLIQINLNTYISPICISTSGYDCIHEISIDNCKSIFTCDGDYIKKEYLNNILYNHDFIYNHFY